MAHDGAAAADRHTVSVEIACDESGSEGEKLVGGNTDVFAHASVLVDRSIADGCIEDLRDRIRSPAVEYKANHVLRTKHRSTLGWLIGPTGPLFGRARVHLVEKPFLVICRLAELTTEDGAGPLARAIYRDGPAALGPSDWSAFLEATNQFVRAQRNGALPRLDPLFGALERTVAYWNQGGRRITIVHDQQSAITPRWISALRASGGLDDFRLVDSRADSRVQLADFLAGTARRIAEDQRLGRGDPDLVRLVRPYVDPASVWGDRPSWSALGPG